MRDALDQIAAAIPLRALLLVRHQDAGLEEQPVPAAHHEAIVERKAQFGRARRIAHRRQRRQIGADGKNVLARQFREVRIGEGRVIARTVARHAEPQRAVEIVVAPAAQARSRGPASDWANRCRRTAYRSACRPRMALPDRRCGSLRSRRLPSAPCRARYPRQSGSSGCLKLELGIGARLRRTQCTKASRRESSASSDVVPAPIGLLGRYSAKARRGGTSCRFAPGLSGRHKPKSGAVIPGTKLRSLKARHNSRDLWCAGAENPT